MTCVDVFASAPPLSRSFIISSDLSHLSGQFIDAKLGKDPEQRRLFFLKIQNLTLGQKSQLAEYIRQHYAEVVDLKQKDELAVSLKRLMDVVLVSQHPAKEFFSISIANGKSPAETFHAWLKLNQEITGTIEKGIASEQVIEMLQLIQKRLSFETNHNYDAQSWKVAFYGSAVNGRSLQGKSDIDVLVEYKEAMNFIYQLDAQKLFVGYGFDHVSPVKYLNLNPVLLKSAALSRVAVTVTAEKIEILVYDFDQETGRVVETPTIYPFQ